MIRTRFAPSPTGYLHIGGVRTALFNWLLARQTGGQFVLRIDDTDSQRNVDEALQPILEGFRWLGMDWDEGPDVGGPHGPYYQSQRSDRYKAAAKQLLDGGFAYRDYATTEEMQQLREDAKAAGEQFVYDRRFMAADDDAAAKYESEGRSGVVRLKMPRQGECVMTDHVRGEVTVQWAGEPDHVIQRADGSCLYHLASVVDDHDFQITHVVRAAEHLPNTARQIFILESLGYERPEYAHLPYVSEPAGTPKLSKRKLDKYIKNKDFAQLLAHGTAIADRMGLTTEADTFNPVIVDFYREIGFQPEAILNYLLLLGWSLDGETEKFTVDEMIKSFTLDRVNKAPASFDPQKLLSFQADAFAALPLERRVELCQPFAAKAGFLDGPDAADTLTKVVQACGDRLKMGGDILDYGYCFSDDFPINEKAYKKRVIKPEGVCDLLRGVSNKIAETTPFEAAQIETDIKAYCEEAEIGIGQIIHALRIAVTGVPAGFGMFESIEVVGQQRTVDRIAALIAKVESETESA